MRDDLAHMRIGVERAVGVILDGHGGQVLARGAELVHVAARDHGEQRREGGTGLDFAGAIARAGQNFGDARGGLRGHLLDAGDQDAIVQSG